MKMQIAQLRYVIAAAQRGSFSRAAQELFVTQPSLSQQIGVLEKELGTLLFFRHSKSVSLTPAGEAFYEYACRVINDTSHIMTDMKSFQDLSTGTLRLGVFWLFTYLDLAGPIQRFGTDHPGLDLQLTMEGSLSLFTMLRRHEIEAAILICSEQMKKDKEMFYHLLHRDHICIMVHQSDPLSSRKSLTIKDLAGKNVILPTKNTPLRDTLESLIQKEQVSFRVICESSHNDINAQIVSQNLAISFSSRSVADKMNAGVYHVIPFQPDIWREVYFAAPKYSLSNPVVKEFIEYLPKLSYS